MNSCGERLKNGLITENPIFVLMLGMCPTLAVTTSAINGLGMGLSTTAVLVMSNLLISMLRKIIPDSVRMPAFIVVVASFVTIVDFLMEGFTPSLYSALGIYIPLIVVNCIILGRAESYASKNPVLPSIFDGLGMGLGFTVALIAIGLVREIIGAGQAFGYQLLPVADTAAGTAGYVPVAIFIQAPGAFLVLAVLEQLSLKYPHIRYEVVLAYFPDHRKESHLPDFPHTLLPEGIEKVPPRFAISWRNRWMLRQADVVVTYVNHTWGGAAQFAALARRQGKAVLPLGKI